MKGHKIEIIKTEELITITDYDENKVRKFVPFILEAAIWEDAKKAALVIKKFYDNLLASENDKSKSYIADGSDIILVNVLNGGTAFHQKVLTELATLDLECEVDTIKISSYGDKIVSGDLRFGKQLSISEKIIPEKIIIFVEDIIDTAKSVNFLIDHHTNIGARAVKLVSHLIKSDRANKNLSENTKKHILTCSRDIPNDYLIGHCLDYKQRCRGYRDIWRMVSEEKI